MWYLLENKLVPTYVRNALVRAATKTTTYHTDAISANIGGTGASMASDGRRSGEKIDTPIDILGDDVEAVLTAGGGHLAETDEELVVTDYNEAVRGSIPSIDGTWLGNHSKEEIEGLSDIVKDTFYAGTPTGPAAGNVGGSTVDILLSFECSGKDYIPIAQGDNVMAFARA
ncbi:hypothetical protein SARC_07515 [Sphaeroforma arctica JP610]|uniref:Uncharacterized protein n=1 Tax=Sphaeroforma arctica JP610 TaxID=667725 RepID=A0A0L0FTI3_9EUKA|nr:hypothetical protein SARC_07515 [Sphaeroforma arctica JP610]KNC80115.1 hypothetical protein SARC_07515 [Sphaeroforma arctica JP610]|eukprot:XP_014154017.1 hypothetical protein SARC_07515 [Sphaeroforma arctica JP610]